MSEQVADVEVTTLGEIVRRTGGILQTGPFGSQLHASDYTTFGTPLIMPINLGDNEIREAGIARVGPTDARRLRRHALREGDVVFSRRGDVGRRSIVRAEQAGWLCGTGCLAARFGSNLSTVNREYLAHYLGSKPAQTWLQDNAVGGTMLNLNTSILAGLPVHLPARTTQDEIVAALDDARFAISNIELLIAKKQAIKQGIMQQLLTGRTRLPGFAGEWAGLTIGDITEQHRRTLDPRQYSTRLFQHFSLPAFDDGRRPRVESGSDIDSIKFIVPDRAVLVSKLNPRIPRVWAPELIGANAIGSTEFVVLTPNGGIDRSFLKWALNSDAITSRMKLLATGTTGSHARIHPRQVASLALAVPSLPEQQAIARTLDDAYAEVDALRDRLDKARDIKQGMMQQLLTDRTRLTVQETAA